MKVNATGMSAAEAAARLLKAIGQLTEPGQVELLVDTQEIADAVMNAADENGLQSAGRHMPQGHFVVSVEVAEVPETGDEKAPPAPVRAPDRNRNIVVQFCSESMGEDASELGRALLKSFIFALTKQEPLPNTLLFYDAGTALTCEGSSVLEDLQAMEQEGVRVLTCRPSLNFNHLSEKLRVGQVVDMYTMARIMIDADHIMKP